MPLAVKIPRENTEIENMLLYILKPCTIHLFHFFPTFSFELAQVERLTEYCDWWLKRRVLAQGSALWVCE